MRATRIAAIITIALCGAALAAEAGAHGSRPRYRSSVHFDFAFGGPGYWYPSPYYYRPYYPRPYYYPYPPVIVQEAPTVYIERGTTLDSRSARSDNWWYYCPNAQAYYPYVKECAGPWQRVAPQPPPSPPAQD